MRSLSVAVLLLCTSLASAQPATMPDKINTVTLSDTIVDTAIDRGGDFYVTTVSGQIQRFDKDGKLAILYKAAQRPTLFQPGDGARLFAYYRQDQHYEFLTPSFEVMAVYKIDPAFAIQPWLICPSSQQRLWLLDQADHSLKKINVRDSTVEIEVRVDTELIGRVEAFKTMREYQNFVFLLNPSKGIFIFNTLGRHIRTIEVPGIDDFQFLGEDLYYLHDGKLVFFNLFTAEARAMSGYRSCSAVLLTDERSILFIDGRIDIFAVRP